MKWIPVKERLPEEDGIYIVDDRIFDNPWVHTAGFVKTSQCWAECSGVYYDDKYCRYDDGRIVAWQPLPKPYGGDADDSCVNCLWHRDNYRMADKVCDGKKKICHKFIRAEK